MRVGAATPPPRYQFNHQFALQPEEQISSTLEVLSATGAIALLIAFNVKHTLTN